jgi:hypothetical protein
MQPKSISIQICLAWANKNRYNHPAIGVLGASSAAQAAGKESLKTKHSAVSTQHSVPERY